MAQQQDAWSTERKIFHLEHTDGAGKPYIYLHDAERGNLGHLEGPPDRRIYVVPNQTVNMAPMGEGESVAYWSLMPSAEAVPLGAPPGSNYWFLSRGNRGRPGVHRGVTVDSSGGTQETYHRDNAPGGEGGTGGLNPKAGLGRPKRKRGPRSKRGKGLGDAIKTGLENAFDPNKNGLAASARQTGEKLANAFDPKKNGLGDAVKGLVENIKNVDWKQVQSQVGDALDPQKNGVSAAFEKFGGDTKRAFEDLGAKIKESAARDKAALDSAFAPFVNEFTNPDSALTKLVKSAGIPLTPEEWKTKFEDPETYFTILSVLVSAAACVLTAGAAAPGAIAATQALIASARVITKAATGKPVGAGDIAGIALACIPKPGGTDPTSWLNAATMVGTSVAKQSLKAAAKNVITSNVKDRLAQMGETLASVSVAAEESSPSDPDEAAIKRGEEDLQNRAGDKYGINSANAQQAEESRKKQEERAMADIASSGKNKEEQAAAAAQYKKDHDPALLQASAQATQNAASNPYSTANQQAETDAKKAESTQPGTLPPLYWVSPSLVSAANPKGIYGIAETQQEYTARTNRTGWPSQFGAFDSSTYTSGRQNGYEKADALAPEPVAAAEPPIDEDMVGGGVFHREGALRTKYLPRAAHAATVGAYVAPQVFGPAAVALNAANRASHVAGMLGVGKHPFHHMDERVMHQNKRPRLDTLDPTFFAGVMHGGARTEEMMIGGRLFHIAPMTENGMVGHGNVNFLVGRPVNFAEANKTGNFLWYGHSLRQEFSRVLPGGTTFQRRNGHVSSTPTQFVLYEVYGDDTHHRGAGVKRTNAHAYCLIDLQPDQNQHHNPIMDFTQHDAYIEFFEAWPKNQGLGTQVWKEFILPFLHQRQKQKVYLEAAGPDARKFWGRQGFADIASLPEVLSQSDLFPMMLALNSHGKPMPSPTHGKPPPSSSSSSSSALPKKDIATRHLLETLISFVGTSTGVHYDLDAVKTVADRLIQAYPRQTNNEQNVRDLVADLRIRKLILQDLDRFQPIDLTGSGMHGGASRAEKEAFSAKFLPLYRKFLQEQDAIKEVEDEVDAAIQKARQENGDQLSRMKEAMSVMAKIGRMETDCEKTIDELAALIQYTPNNVVDEASYEMNLVGKPGTLDMAGVMHRLNQVRGYIENNRGMLKSLHDEIKEREAAA
jgi:hypothetical protein